MDRLRLSGAGFVKLMKCVLGIGRILHGIGGTGTGSISRVELEGNEIRTRKTENFLKTKHHSLLDFYQKSRLFELSIDFFFYHRQE